MVKSGRKGYEPRSKNRSNRERKSIIVIVAEGKNKTETQYFRDLAKKVNTIVKFVPSNYTDPVNMVNSLKKWCKENEIRYGTRIIFDNYPF